MSAGSPAEAVLELGPSRALAFVLAALHAGAALIAATLPLNGYWRLGLLAFVGVSLCRALARHALRFAPAAIVALALGEEERCALRRRKGPGWEEGRVIDCWVHPRLTLLVVRASGRRQAAGVVIPADAVAAEPFRQLRVRLRLGRAPA